MPPFLWFVILFIGSSVSQNLTGLYKCRFTGERGIIDCLNIQGISKQYKNAEDLVEDAGSVIWWVDLFVVAIIVISAGMMSGLTIGLMGLDITTLDIISRSGGKKQRIYAKRILPLLKRHHLLLVTLLLMNALAMESLPIFLERLVSPVVAVVVSVTLILLFGEIVPQALCSRYGLAIGGNLSYLVWFLIFVCFIVAWPIGKLLDFLIGTEHGTFFKRTELKHLMDLHGKKDSRLSPEDRLSPDEITIIKGALDLKTKKVSDVMTPLKDVDMLNVEKKFDNETVKTIIDFGHSRMPVYQNNKENIVGMLLVKNLILLDPFDEIPISSLELIQLQKVSLNTPLYDMLNIFQQGSHMAIVVDVDNITTLGIVTLEAVIEELIQKEIQDETDKKHKKKKPTFIEKPISELSEEIGKDKDYLKKEPRPIVKSTQGTPKKEKVLSAKNFKNKIQKVLKVNGEKGTKAPLLTEEQEGDEIDLGPSSLISRKSKKAEKDDFTEISLEEPEEDNTNSNLL